MLRCLSSQKHTLWQNMTPFVGTLSEEKEENRRSKLSTFLENPLQAVLQTMLLYES